MMTNDHENRAQTPEEYASANPPRARVLQEAERLTCGDRNRTYGPPTQNFKNIAEFWTTRIGHKLKDGETITSTDVADLMVLLKVARNIAQIKKDNFVDAAAYSACGWECHLEETREH